VTDKRSSDARIAKLESDLTHLSKLYDDLNQVVAEQNQELLEQSRTIERLVREIKALKEKPTAAEPMSLEDEKPPHY